MNKELTFNDLPMVVAQLRDEVVGMKQMITNLQLQKIMKRCLFFTTLEAHLLNCH